MQQVPLDGYLGTATKQRLRIYYAMNLLRVHGYTNWSVRIVPDLPCAGKTDFENKTVLLHPEATHEVIIHEVSHVRLGQFREDFHDQPWRDMVISMGATPQTHYTKP